MALLGLILFYVFLYFGLCAEGRHECDRLCFENEPPKKCYYRFTVGVSQRKDLSPRAFLAVNGRSPGPPISVCENDVIVVDVRNELPSGLETSLHWHGFMGGNSPFMDGVPMITQCPISPRTTFRYQLRAHKSGSYFYRAHSVAQQLDGIYGPLVVHDGKDQTSPEKIVIVSPKMEGLQVFENSFEQDLRVRALQVSVYNVSFNGAKYEENVAHRVRVINAAALDCPITLFTHIVPLKVTAVDGNTVKTVGLNEVIVNPGERVDLLVKPEVMKVTHIIGHQLCEGLARYGFETAVRAVSDRSDKIISRKTLNFAEMLRKLETAEAENLPRGDLRVLLSFDASVYTEFKGKVDFRYKLGAFTQSAPSVFSKKKVTLLQFHNKSFGYPPSPMLSQPKELKEDMMCQPGTISDSCKENDNGFCECLQTVDLPFNYNLDLFLIDEGKNSDINQTLHMHGHSFYVLAMKSFGRPITAVELWDKEVLGEIQRNLVNPIMKDTIVVPNKGYVILRVRPTNPGKWLLESTTSKATTGYGLEVILNVENPAEHQVPPRGFPTCGNFKEPDLVFTDD